MTLPTPPRLQWFLDRIGTRVWPSKPICYCDKCTSDYMGGIFIYDEINANRAYNLELSDPELTFFETKEQRDEYERRI